jgi:long-chain fatty acid transport protein
LAVVGGMCLGGVITSPVWALGIRIADQDPFATARGNAFAATADNPSAIYYNPAGLTQLEGHHLRIGGYSIALKSEFTSPAGAQFSTKGRVEFAPQFYYAYGMKAQPLAFGVGLYAPYGLALEWPDNTVFGPVFGKMTYLSLNPVAAWQVHPTLSLAAGVTLNYGDTEIRQQAITGAPGSLNRFQGEDVDAGFNLGLLWQPMKPHSIGVNYRSPTTQNFSGSSTTTGAGPTVSGAASARIPFPRHIVFGYSFRPTPDWNLEFNADWTEWSRLTTVNFVQPGGTFPAPFNWRSSWFYEFGLTRRFEGGWRASAGYIYSENSVPDANFSPLVPDSDRHIFSLGVGRQQPRVSWDVAYQLGWGPSRTVAGNTLAFPLAIPPPSATANGSYTFLSHAVTAAVALRF